MGKRNRSRGAISFDSAKGDRHIFRRPTKTKLATMGNVPRVPHCSHCRVTPMSPDPNSPPSAPGDDPSIANRSWTPKTPSRALVIFVHGFTEHCGRYEHVAQALVARGVAVHALDLRGHGRS